MRWLVLALLALIGVELGLFRAGQRGERELLEAARGDDPGAALFALHVLANRGETIPLDEDRVRALLTSEHPRAREFAMTWDGTRSAGDDLQRAYLAGLDDAAELARCDFYLRHQVLRPTLARLREYLAHSSSPR